jgi:hypothetical protein
LKNQPVFKISFYVALMSSIAMGIFGIGTGELTLTTLTPQAWFISTVFALLCTVVALSLLQKKTLPHWQELSRKTLAYRGLL